MKNVSIFDSTKLNIIVMKTLTTLLALLLTMTTFSQSITVNTNTHTVPELVNNVLINSNCVSGSNISWSTGTQFGSTNGIGYFQNTNPNFPIQSGVILSTGNVLNAGGPNSSSLNDGNASWTGDTALENTLAQSNITMHSVNASVLEFDFTPISANFSFDFVFASEEYGNFQCQFSDAFAFLLTNTLTGETTNLAVIPGTNLPISVVTIRNAAYNSTCDSANANYFGKYNGGAAAAGSAINFNGQTVLMTAGATLIPNTPYHIKLVIADRGDSLSDSAIFLSSNSFNIGQNVLGANLTNATQNAVCYGTNQVINSGLDPQIYSFVWKKNGVVIPGATSPSLTVTTPGTYSLTYNKIVMPCDAVTDSIEVEYTPQITFPNPKDLNKCNTGAASYDFDFNINTSYIIPLNNNTLSASYYSNLADAQNGINALSTVYASAGNQTIYVAVKSSITGCVAIKSFQLKVTTPPTAHQPNNLEKCERELNSHDAYFNIHSQTPSILNGLPAAEYTVTYYTSLEAANAGTAPMYTTNYLASNGTTIYARMQNNTDGACYSITHFQIIVHTVPVAQTLQSILQCDPYVLPALSYGTYYTGPNGTGDMLHAGDVLTESQLVYIYANNGYCATQSHFTVTIVDLNHVGPNSGTYCDNFVLPSSQYAKYYTLPNGGGTQLFAGNVISTSQTIYLYYQSTTGTFCHREREIQLTIVPSPVITNPSNVFSCDAYMLPELAVGTYYAGPNKTGGMIPPFTVINYTQDIYIYAESNTTPNCTSEKHFKVYIGLDQMQDVNTCVQYTLPALPIGNYYTGIDGTGEQLHAGDAIFSTQTLYVYAISNTGCYDNEAFTVDIALPILLATPNVEACASYTLPELSVGQYYTGTNGSGVALHAGDVITSTKTIYVYVNNNDGCHNQRSFVVTIHPNPVLDARSDMDVCGTYKLTPLTVGNYYTAPNGGGSIIAAGTVLTTTQTIYMHAVSSFGCISDNQFTVNIYITNADAPANVTQCDTYTLPALTANNKYYTKAGGPNGTGIELLAGSAITSTQTVWVYKQNIIRQDFMCYDEHSFVVTINHTPYINTIPNVNACNSYTLPNLTVGNYFTQPNGTGTMLHAGDIITTNQDLYVFAQTNTVPNCFDEKSFHIDIYNVSELPNKYVCTGYVLPSIEKGKFYTGTNGTGTLLNPGTMITSTQKIYIFGHSPLNPNCSDESSFDVIKLPMPEIHNVPEANRTICDNDGANDGQASFDLTSLNSIILGNQTGSEFELAYYGNMDDLLHNTNPLSTTLLHSVFVKLINNLAPDCYEYKQLKLNVKKLPEPNPTNGVICVDELTGAIKNPYTIMSTLSPTQYSFNWTLNGVSVGNQSFITVSEPGVYSVVATDLQTGCISKPTQAIVEKSQKALVAYTMGEAFDDNQDITVIATGSGDYEYQLDNSEFQDEPVFHNPTFGDHIISVRDKNGCGITTKVVILANHPKYFTPNADGINDTWNVVGLKDQPNATVDIFDRTGKFIIQIKTNGEGWDGNFNGALLPSDDYWFVAHYIEKGEAKEFKSHFTMKR